MVHKGQGSSRKQRRQSSNFRPVAATSFFNTRERTAGKQWFFVRPSTKQQEKGMMFTRCQ